MWYNSRKFARRDVMGDSWDYRLSRMDMAWEIALRVIPEKTEPSGAWTEDAYIAKAQEVLKKASDAVNAVFKEVPD